MIGTVIVTLHVATSTRMASSQTGLSDALVLEVCTMMREHNVVYNQNRAIFPGGKIEVYDICYGSGPQGRRGNGVQRNIILGIYSTGTLL